MELDKEYRYSEADYWLGRDAASYPSPYLDAILRMSPGDVVALSREAEARARALDEDPEKEINDSYPWEDIAGDIDDALRQLPQRDLVHARAVYSILTASPVKADRHEAACIVTAIVPFDREFGLQLWDRLLGDRSKKVRLEASGLLRQNFDLTDRGEDPEQRSEQGLRRLGLTWRDAFQLMRTYAEAEHGWVRKDIGRTVLDQLLKDSDAEPDTDS